MAQAARIELKSPREIDLLRTAGHVAAEVLFSLKKSIVAGMTTREIDAMAAKMMRERSVVPSFLHYRGYPATVCTSVNEEIVHGIPSQRRLKDGDLRALISVCLSKAIAAIRRPRGSLAPRSQTNKSV